MFFKVPESHLSADRQAITGILRFRSNQLAFHENVFAYLILGNHTVPVYETGLQKYLDTFVPRYFRKEIQKKLQWKKRKSLLMTDKKKEAPLEVPPFI